MVLAAEIMGHYRSYQILGTIGEAFAGDDPVVAGLRHSMEQERERIFRLTGLLGASDDVQSAYEGLSDREPDACAPTRSSCSTTCSAPDLRRLLVPLVDPQVTVGRARRARQPDRRRRGRSRAKRRSRRSSPATTRGCGRAASTRWARCGCRPSREQIDRFADADDPLLRETVRAAKQRLQRRRSSRTPRRTRCAPGRETGLFDIRDDAGGVGLAAGGEPDRRRRAAARAADASGAASGSGGSRGGALRGRGRRLEAARRPVSGSSASNPSSRSSVDEGVDDLRVELPALLPLDLGDRLARPATPSCTGARASARRTRPRRRRSG